MAETGKQAIGFVALALLLAIGALFLIVSAAWDGSWWTLTTGKLSPTALQAILPLPWLVFLCILVPLPNKLARKYASYSDYMQPNHTVLEIGYFMTSCVIVTSICKSSIRSSVGSAWGSYALPPGESGDSIFLFVS